MDKLVNGFMNSKIILYTATLLSFLTPSKVNKFLLITCGYIVVLKFYETIYK